MAKLVSISEATALHCSHRLPIVAVPNDIDLFGNVSSDAIVRYMDRGRVECIEAIAQNEGRESWLTEYTVNVYRLDVGFWDRAALGEKLAVLSGVRRSTSHRATFDQLVVHADTNNILAESQIEILFLEHPSRALTQPPQEIPLLEDYKSSTDLGAALPPIPFSKNDHFVQETPLRVYYEHTDTQGIVYHAVYLRLCEGALYNWIGKAPSIVKQHIRYLNASKLGDQLVIHIGRRELDADHTVFDFKVFNQTESKISAVVMLEVKN